MVWLDRLSDEEGEWEETKKMELFPSAVWDKVRFGYQDLHIEEISGEKKGSYSPFLQEKKCSEHDSFLPLI